MRSVNPSNESNTNNKMQKNNFNKRKDKHNPYIISTELKLFELKNYCKINAAHENEINKQCFQKKCNTKMVKIVSTDICKSQLIFQEKSSNILENHDSEILLFLHNRISHQSGTNSLRSCKQIVFIEKSHFDLLISQKVTTASCLWKECRHDLIRYKQYANYATTETNINQIILLVQIFYKNIKNLLRLIKPTNKIDMTESPLFILLIDFEKLKNYLSSQNTISYIDHYQNIIYRPSQPKNIKYIHKARKLDFPPAYNAIKMSIESQSMKFNMLCDFQSICNEFSKLLAFLHSVSTEDSISENVSPSLNLSCWYFRNITQGYLFRSLLKNSNINSLNFMRNFYYVLITSTSTNFTVEINFKLRNGVFMSYEANNTSKNLYEKIQWNIDHQNIMRKYSLCSLSNITENSKLNDQRKALTYIKHFPTKNFNTQAETSLLEDNVIDDKSNFYYSDSETVVHTSSKSSNKSLSHILSAQGNILHQLSSEKPRFQIIPDKLFNNIIQENSKMYNLNFLHSKVWLSKIFCQLKQSKAEFDTSVLNCIRLNECIFDDVYVAEYLQDIGYQCLDYFASITFYKGFLKSLGQSVMHTLFSSV